MISPIVLQRRMRQLGEIRIGHVVPMANGKTRPEKLKQFRFTSPSKEILEAVGREYGGAPQPWTPANGGPEEYEVYSTVSRLPVIIPPTAVTQWFERYEGSRCVVRCDGLQDLKRDVPCHCDPEKRACSITTRLNVLLRDVGPIGYWLLVTRGYYAATELPPVADLLSQSGGHVPGWLSVEERRIVSEKVGGGTETRRFMVPTLDIDIAPAQLLAGMGSIGPALESVNHTTGEINGTEVKAISPGPSCDAFIQRAMDSRDAATVRKIWTDADGAGCLYAPVRIGETDTTLKSMLTTLGTKFAQIEAAKPAPSPDGDAPADRVAAWTAALAAAAPRTTDEVLAELYRANGGREPIDCTVSELRSFAEMMAAAVEAEPEASPDLEKSPF